MPAEITTDVLRTAAVLRAGGLVAFATETVYGLGANALDETAVARIFEAKGRPRFDPLIVHLASPNDLPALVQDVPPLARQLAARFWPGPLTLVLPKRPIVPDLVTAGLPNVAVRVPDHPQALELLAAAGCPVAAPSANPFGRVSPTTAQHVADQLGDRVDLILDGGPCRVGIESTVLQIRPDGAALLRPGGVTVEELEPFTGPLLTGETGPADVPEGQAAAAPGMLARHYSPHLPIVIVEDWSSLPPDPTAAALGLRTAPSGFLVSEALSARGDLTEAAARFFAALRRLDESKAARLYVERFPSHGLGVALNDRLRRAATR